MNIEQYSTTICSKCGELIPTGSEKKCVGIICSICGKVHDMESKTYVSVQGNILIGMEGGLVGDNLENDTVKKMSIFCRGKCFSMVCGAALYTKENSPVKPKDDLPESWDRPEDII